MMGKRGGVAVVSPTSSSGRKHGEESAFLLSPRVSSYHSIILCLSAQSEVLFCVRLCLLSLES